MAKEYLSTLNHVFKDSGKTIIKSKEFKSLTREFIKELT